MTRNSLVKRAVCWISFSSMLSVFRVVGYVADVTLSEGGESEEGGEGRCGMRAGTGIGFGGGFGRLRERR